MLNREKVEEAMDRLAEDFGISEAFRNSPTWWTLIELAEGRFAADAETVEDFMAAAETMVIAAGLVYKDLVDMED